MGDIRVDLDTATRAELVAEIQRLHDVNQRWSESWQGIVKANADAWVHQVTELKSRVALLEGLLNDDIQRRHEALKQEE
ncbi:hypothetical protein J4U00_gp123 [Mycobacterium phage DyoEdafos]|uniref:Uncharacterized protein n=1 Tax=Mycobacterium phage DyoEdafos TaxID=2599860 RepID=A0A5J6TK51_9CAUD|nr:hypothetical protein J4U00_gp123 [Mycobacterium phage DyoEdafos]QFG10357.1 hypothetical protein SEA_DYOEDAFOS_146 [Mycobacterium phage DyoEdafos]